KIYLFYSLLAVSTFSCKKLVQQQERNAAMNIITNGVWYVTLYSENGTDITSSFSGYVFQFKQDGTVVGTKDSVSITGTWAANINDHTITSNFPNASSPLVKLNGVWKITDSSVDYVVANATINDSTENLKLQKQ
ncbi:MAG: hypothetical protein JST13_15175, partial [Bacteroidetes bacterium]|nr:hypothetical protein [Bacteroidota bacterium]